MLLSEAENEDDFEIDVDEDDIIGSGLQATNKMPSH